MKLSACVFFVSGMLFASVIFSGCASSHNDPFFSDNPGSPAVAGTSSATNLADVARFHVGETVAVTFSETPDPIPAHSEQIKEDGTITMPYIGKIHAVGRTSGELQNEIHDLYVPQYFVRLTITVSPGDLVYYVTGEVKGPGRQLYVGQITVAKAITSAGDFTDFANHKNVRLIRANGQQIKVNVDKILAGKIPDSPVYPGDQIQVQRKIF